jgi:hypothetical protein
VSLTVYMAGLLLIGAVAWAAASPFFGWRSGTTSLPESLLHERWRRRKEEALSAIKDAELDFHMGKLSEPDYHQLRGRLESQALEAMGELERQPDGDAR